MSSCVVSDREVWNNSGVFVSEDDTSHFNASMVEYKEKVYGVVIHLSGSSSMDESALLDYKHL